MLLLMPLASLPTYAASAYAPGSSYPMAPSASGSPWAWGVWTQETPNGYMIVVKTHGFSPPELQMSIHNGVLVMERTQISGGPMSGWSFGSFHWMLPLPPDIDLKGIRGRAGSDTLKVFIPKRAVPDSSWLR